MLLTWLSPLIVLAARIFWQRRPGLATCALFWGIALAFVLIGWSFSPSQVLLSLGILGNASVTLANGGFMPVAVRRRLSQGARSLWVQRESGQRLLFLADNFGTNSFRFSLGDVCLLAGIILSVGGF